MVDICLTAFYDIKRIYLSSVKHVFSYIFKETLLAWFKQRLNQLKLRCRFHIESRYYELV